MMYPAQRRDLLAMTRALVEMGVLNSAGGALSVRLPDGNILLSCGGSAFGRWQISERDFIVLDPEGRIVERTAGLGVAATTTHLLIYRHFPAAQACAHAHAPYSLAFASLGTPVPSVTNRVDVLGQIPCLAADDTAIKAAYLADPRPLPIPDGMIQRPDAGVVNLEHIEPQLLEHFAPRQRGLERHGLAFTIYRHGVFAMARSLDEAVDNLARVEESARTAV